jgi:hypothetical protein
VYYFGVGCEWATWEKKVEAFAAFGRWLSNTAYWVLDLVGSVLTPASESDTDRVAADVPSTKFSAIDYVGLYTCRAEAAADGAMSKVGDDEAGGAGFYM